MTQLWRLYLDYRDRIPFPPSKRAFAEKLGMSPTAFNNWEHSIRNLPDRMNLVRFARQIQMPYERVLDAALHDAGYLPEPREEGGGAHGGAAPTNGPGSSSGNVSDLTRGRKAARRTRSGQRTAEQQRRAELDEVGEESQDPDDGVDPG